MGRSDGTHKRGGAGVGILVVYMAKPIVLTILDGWGYRAETNGNAIALARKPVYDGLLRDFPSTLIHASDHFVGLPDGQMGNSEVGHLNLGAGRIVRMDMTRIDLAILDGSLMLNPVLLAAVSHAQDHNGAVHFIGLLSDGGVHSHSRHLYGLLKLMAQKKLKRVYVHAFMDGRDTSPTGGAGYIEDLQREFREIGVGQLASVSGRYFAMDRDLRWEKEHQAFDAMVTGHPSGGEYADPVARVKDLYNTGITDEFIPPFTVVDAAGARRGSDSRQRCGDQLQLSGGPRKADYAGAGAELRVDGERRDRSAKGGGAGSGDSEGERCRRICFTSA